jgi:lipoprotein LprG
MQRRLPALVLALATACALTSCSGGSDQKVSSGRTPAQVLALAKKTLDETSGVHISLSGKPPEGTPGITAADGIGTHAPAFDGSITVTLSGQTVEVPVVAVGGKVYAKIPFTLGWSDVDPASYGAPDPAQLLDPEDGFSGMLTATQDPAEGDTVRGGEGNKDVLTEYTGTVPADSVTGIIPSASGDFDAVYTISSAGQLVSMRLSGVFYPGSTSTTYAVAFDHYGTSKDIAAP